MSEPDMDYLLQLPLAPSVNEAYSERILSTGSGRLYTRRVASKKLEEFKLLAGQYLSMQLRGHRMAPGTRFGYRADIYMPSASSDLSNRLKALEDVIAVALGNDDKHIYDIHVRKFVDVKYPRIDVQLYIINDAMPPLVECVNRESKEDDCSTF